MLPFKRSPKTGTEKETLVGVLNELRSIMLWKLDGLDDEQAARPMVASGTVTSFARWSTAPPGITPGD